MPRATKANSLSETFGKPWDSKNIDHNILKRQTDELILAFCGPIGSQITEVAKKVKQVLEEYGFTVEFIEIGEILKENFDKVKELSIKSAGIENPDFDRDFDKMSYAQRTDLLQSTGNELRNKYSRSILSQIAIKKIGYERRKWEKREPSGKTKIDDLLMKSKPRRYATIIDCLKHPDEVTLLQEVYGKMFYLFGVLRPSSARKKWLYDQGVSEADASYLVNRDKSEEEKYGQQVLKTLQYADFFVRSIEEKTGKIENCVRRYIKILLGDTERTPTVDEYAMYSAQSAAYRSSCLSRQVGAAVIDNDDNLLATGYNDTPRYEGGHCLSHDNKDNRCLKFTDGACKNEVIKKNIITNIEEILKDKIHGTGIKKQKADEMIIDISEAISSEERLKSLLEFSKAVHAEMDVITSVARTGNGSLKNATLYCTTFPCHICARHIIASGITKVIYIEPYEKSLAIELHGEEIENEPIDENENNKVLFLPFEGVAPRQYLNLFRVGKRKDDEGKLKKVNFRSAHPVISQILASHIHFETKIADSVESLEF